MTDNNSNAVIPVSADRCTPGGQTGVDAMDWFLRAGLAMLAVAAIWFVVVVIKPLPVGESQSPPAIPGLVDLQTNPVSIEEREHRLVLLNEKGNIFASDRLNWPVQMTKTPESNTEFVNNRSEGRTPAAIATSNQDIDTIEIADNAPTAIKKRLDQIKLRGVYVVGDVPVAMIGKKTNSSSESYRIGDSFDDNEWRLVAIDDIRDRVILHRSGLNFELKLYDTGTDAYASASPRTSISATNTAGGVEIDFTSLDKVATELREAGVPRDQINELITLAQSNPGEEDFPEKTNDTESDDAKPISVPPAMPPGMVQLFRAMAEGSRNVVAPPPTPKSEQGDNADASEKTENKDSGESSDKKEKDS